MNTLVVTPGEGVGPLKLGMTRQEIEESLAQLRQELEVKAALQVGRDEQDGGDCHCVRYMFGPLFFMVTYTPEEKAVGISINRGAVEEELLDVVLLEQDVFRTEAEPLVEALKVHDRCVHDQEDELLSFQYTFPALGVRLWREMPFHRKLLEDPAWMAEMEAVLEDEYQHLYFDIVTVYVPDYGKVLCYL